MSSTGVVESAGPAGTHDLLEAREIAESLEGTGTQEGADAHALAKQEQEELAKWQRKLLPFMTWFLVAIVVAFFVFSAYDEYKLRQFVAANSSASLRSGIEKVVQARIEGQNIRTSDLIAQSLLILEAESMDKRYQQASALLMSRIWTRQLAFITGMVLSFIGSIFILGKMTEARTEANVGVEQFKSAISSTSPGLILAFFGTVLIGTSLVVQPKIEVQDRPLYYNMVGLTQNPKSQDVSGIDENPDKELGAFDNASISAPTDKESKSGPKVQGKTPRP